MVRKQVPLLMCVRIVLCSSEYVRRRGVFISHKFQKKVIAEEEEEEAFSRKCPVLGPLVFFFSFSSKFEKVCMAGQLLLMPISA
jgi:hypothetical protein